MNSLELTKRIIHCLGYEGEEREKEEIALYNELSQCDSFLVRCAISNLCKKIENIGDAVKNPL